MITIKVGGKPLYIPKDTTLVLEQNNNVFNPEGFMEDIVWTFSIPAKPNQKTLARCSTSTICRAAATIARWTWTESR